MREILAASRPFSWVNTAYPFAAGALMATGGRLDATLVVGTLFFLVPYNLLMYGVNDVFDYASDLRNPRKGGIEGGLVAPERARAVHRRILVACVVSTVPFTHATPAAFVSHNKSRSNYKPIGTEILIQVKPEVVIGGGHPGYDGSPTYSYISDTDYLNFKNGIYASEYVFVEREAGKDGGVSVLTAAQQAAAGGKKLFGLYGMEGGGNFESLEPQDLPGTPLVTQNTRENPSFSEATLAALKVLSQDPDGFFLMAEQGDIDWANHANDFKRMVGTTKDLHDGVQAVIDFVNQPDDEIDWDNTLLVVTSDHSNSYMRNKEVLVAGDLPQQNGASYPDGEVTYGSGAHTNELVRLYAMGAGTRKFHKYEGSWYRGTRILDNTQLFHMMMEAAGEPVDSPLKAK
jgi:alkaline phosphatase